MAANTRELVKRRKAIRNIRKITKTMELIATSRFQRALVRAQQSQAYTQKIAELAAEVSATVTDYRHPLMVKREPVKNSLLLVICSNRGLCGGYNAGILREANSRVRVSRSTDEQLQLELSGKRAISAFRYQGIRPAMTFTKFEDKPRFEEVAELANRYIDLYTHAKIDRLDVAWMKFINAGKQVAVVETLLPLSAAAPSPGGEAHASRVVYEFVPNPQDILEELLPTSFKVRLFKCFLDAAVSEQIARRVTMKQATENADEIIKSISSQYNRARQAKITKEIAELIGGAEALK